MVKQYFVVTTMNSVPLAGGWFIVAGPFGRWTEAAKDTTYSDCTNPAYRNAAIVSRSNLRKLTVGIPRRRIGNSGAKDLLARFFQVAIDCKCNQCLEAIEPALPNSTSKPKKRIGI